MIMPSRNANDGSGYSYGFQGQEKDDEIKGEGNSVNYKYRMHDPRIGRFFAVDPLAADYPHYTPYSFSGNKVIHAIELEGMEELIIHMITNMKGESKIKVYTVNDVNYDVKKSLSGGHKSTWWYYAMNPSNKAEWKTGYDEYRKGATKPEDNGSSVDGYRGPRTGGLLIHTDAKSNSTNIYYDSQNFGIADNLKERKQEIFNEGASNVFAGLGTMVSSVVTTVFTGGLYAPATTASFGFGLDQFFGGLNGLFDPEGVAKGKEPKPVKWLAVQILGENGALTYEALNVSVGFQAALSDKNTVGIFGVFNTSQSANEAIEDLIKKAKNDMLEKNKLIEKAKSKMIEENVK